MIPFWVVTRMTHAELARSGIDAYAKKVGVPRRFNCWFTTHVVTSSMAGCDWTFEIPVLTNTMDLVEGEQLILEDHGGPAKQTTQTKRTITSKDHVALQEPEKNKQKVCTFRVAKMRLHIRSRG